MNDLKFCGSMKKKPMKGKNGEWEKTSLSFTEADLREMQEHLKNGWVNLEVKISQKTGNPYIVLDDYVSAKKSDFEQPQQNQAYPPPTMEAPEDSLPF